MRTPEFVNSAPLSALHVDPADADGHAFYRQLRPAFGIRHRRADRFRHRVLIGHAPLRPTCRRG